MVLAVYSYFGHDESSRPVVEVTGSKSTDKTSKQPCDLLESDQTEHN